MIKKEANNKARIRRHERVRKTISGTKNVPRLNVFRSNKGIYAQVIDDVAKTTLASSSSLELKLANGGNIEAAKAVGKDVADDILLEGYGRILVNITSDGKVIIKNLD